MKSKIEGLIKNASNSHEDYLKCASYVQNLEIENERLNRDQILLNLHGYFPQDLGELITSTIDKNEELEAIIKDFMTTKEDLRTWREEMYGTIVEVVGEFEEDDVKI